MLQDYPICLSIREKKTTKKTVPWGEKKLCHGSSPVLPLEIQVAHLMSYTWVSGPAHLQATTLLSVLGLLFLNISSAKVMQIHYEIQ